ncbi:hypothetical protein FOZ61_000476 [Perkinsus olseni]|uniref:Uncharacterized protein n=1 Tax=Perkinsus olseni TaxID=32597 RepID=A0A7J6MHC4_PEROL|nr:hypothetical protein FOZ61_000476 [Perkinsus olseni]KAF4670836.1 hypothetical protein FOL46_000615 [Perkinsus olseni]
MAVVRTLPPLLLRLFVAYCYILAVAAYDAKGWDRQAEAQALFERNSFERAGRWGDLRDPNRPEADSSGRRYDPYTWYDRLEYAASRRRRLVEARTAQVHGQWRM